MQLDTSFNLGLYYEQQKDLKNAKGYFDKAIQQGHLIAQFRLNALQKAHQAKSADTSDPIRVQEQAQARKSSQVAVSSATKTEVPRQQDQTAKEDPSVQATRVLYYLDPATIHPDYASARSVFNNAPVKAIKKVVSLLRNRENWFGQDASNLRNKNLNADDAKVLAVILTQFPNLKRLWLENNNFGPAGIRDLAPVFRAMTGLTEVELGGSNMGVEGMRVLEPVLKTMTNLRLLMLENNNLGVEGMRVLEPALRDMTNIMGLGLAGNNLGVEGMRVLAPALKSMTGMTHLMLSNNNLGMEGARILEPALKVMTGMKRLWLANNNFGIEGACLLEPGLRAMSGLEVLWLENNNIDAKRCRVLGSLRRDLEINI